MSIDVQPRSTTMVIYPTSDGQPMSDNTKQFRWIQTIHGGLDALFRERPDVFVAGDLLWYPVEGRPTICRAPDAMVVFGRPKGDRGAYLQWEEGNIAPQVVFEIRSPSNSDSEMEQKLAFYDRYHVEEYYLYDPDTYDLSGWVRKDGHLVGLMHMNNWVSPRLGIRFVLTHDDLTIYRPDGTPFVSYAELDQQRQAADQRAQAADQRAQAADQRAQEERQRADAAEERLRRIEEYLRSLTIDPDQV